MAEILTLSQYIELDDLPSPPESDEQIQAAINSAIALIENRTGRTFELSDPSPVEIEELLDGNKSPRLYTKNAPIVAISSIEYYDGSQFVEIDIVSQPYTFRPGTNSVYFTNGHVFPAGYQNIRITYSYGYENEFPKDLTYACYLLAKHIVDLTSRQGIRSQQDGEQTFSYEQNLPEQVDKTIIRYKTVW